MEKEKVAAEPGGCAEESRVKSQEPGGYAEESRDKSQEPGGYAEESKVKSQEPSGDVIYELSESSEDSENSDNADNSDNAENAENSQPLSEAEIRLREMVTEMGAETVLEIIRDNRNAAIRQILSEVEAQRTPLQTGVSAERGCNSIFDLAALA